MTTKRLTKNVWHKVVAPAANTVYIQPPRVTGLLLQYGATTPPADDVTGLFYDRLITLNAGLTAWVKPSASGNVFVTDTAGGDPMPDTDAPLHLTTNLAQQRTVTEGDDVTYEVVAAGGKTPYSYEWYYNPGYGADVLLTTAVWGPTAATGTLHDNDITQSHGGSYRCVVYDASGDAVSSVQQTIIVNPAPPVTVTAKTGATAAVGATIQPGAMFTFGNSAATDYTYTTTTPAATATLVAGTGVVTGVAAGTGNVTATHKTKPSVTATATYTITAAP